MNRSGFREIAHTADWELEVWAPDLAGLLEQAARGMYALSGARSSGKPRLVERIELSAPDPESLLVGFLSELLWRVSELGQVFEHFQIQIQGTETTNGAEAEEFLLKAALEGSPRTAWEKEIKAVTWHRLAVNRGVDRLTVRIVFDV